MLRGVFRLFVDHLGLFSWYFVEVPNASPRRQRFLDSKELHSTYIIDI